MTALHAAPLHVLRSRTSEKWREYPDDVIPMFVAEADFPLAPAIADALHAAIESGDTGYVASRTPLPSAFADFAERRWAGTSQRLTSRPPRTSAWESWRSSVASTWGADSS
jgi:bifunctional pyridoxal-dependent enzyme with beta-cystathionase and maltose regulon repressor activities